MKEAFWIYWEVAKGISWSNSFEVESKGIIGPLLWASRGRFWKGAWYCVTIRLSSVSRYSRRAMTSNCDSVPMEVPELARRYNRERFRWSDCVDCSRVLFWRSLFSYPSKWWVYKSFLGLRSCKIWMFYQWILKIALLCWSEQVWQPTEISPSSVKERKNSKVERYVFNHSRQIIWIKQVI